MFTKSLISAFAVAAVARCVAGQYQDMPPAMGPWVRIQMLSPNFSDNDNSHPWRVQFDINTMDVDGDHGDSATVDPATEIAGWYDMTDVWRTTQKVLSPAMWGRYFFLSLCYFSLPVTFLIDL
jgi:L-lactate dehydrogenase (cytochrome)